MALFTYKATVCFSGMDAKKHPSGPVKGEVASPIAEDDRLSTRQLSPCRPAGQSGRRMPQRIHFERTKRVRDQKKNNNKKNQQTNIQRGSTKK